MPNPKPSVMPEYDCVMMALSVEMIQGIAWATAPVLGRIQKTAVTEVPQGSAPPEVALGAYTPIEMQSSLTETVESILAADVDAWVAMIAEEGEKAGEAVEKQFFKFLEQVTAKSGQVVDAGGRPLSHDLVLDMFDKMPIDFDAAGNPEMPTIVVHPNAMKFLGEPTKEQLKRCDEIIERKRREFLARRRVRKLD